MPTLLEDSSFPASFVHRLEAVETKLCRCGYCGEKSMHDATLVSVFPPSRFICDSCLQNGQQFFNDADREIATQKALDCSIHGKEVPQEELQPRPIPLPFCEECTSLGLKVVEEAKSRSENSQRRNLLARILWLEYTFAARLPKPANGHLIERLPRMSFHKALHENSWKKAWSKKFTPDEIYHRLADLEELPFLY